MTAEQLIWEHDVPSVTASCLAGGNSLSGLPVTVVAGSSGGRVQVWGEDDERCIFEHDLGRGARVSAACVTATACLNVAGVLPRVAACDASGQVGLFEITQASLEHVGQVKAHEACATDVAVNEFGVAVMASCGEDGVVRLHDLAALHAAGALRQSDRAALHGLHFWSADSLAIASASPAAPVQIWDVRTPTAARLRCDGSTAASRCVASHSSQPFQLASGDADGNVLLWDLRTGTPLRHFAAHADAVCALRFHPNRPGALLSAGLDGVVQALDVASPAGATALLHDFDGMACLSMDVAVDDLGGPLLMATAMDETVILKPLVLE